VQGSPDLRYHNYYLRDPARQVLDQKNYVLSLRCAQTLGAPEEQFLKPGTQTEGGYWPLMSIEFKYCILDEGYKT
jgi:hypothetical protein